MNYNDPLLAQLAAQAEKQYGLPARILDAIRLGGERSNSNQVSPKGAQGVYQFIPATWAAYGGGKSPTDPMAATEAAAKFVADLMQQYGGNIPAVLAHYNGGGRAGKAAAAGAPLNPETAAYIPRALAVMRQTPESPTPRLNVADNRAAEMPSAMEESDPFNIGLMSPEEITPPALPGFPGQENEAGEGFDMDGDEGVESTLGLDGAMEGDYIPREAPLSINLAPELKYGGHADSDLRALFEEAFADDTVR